MAIEVDEGDAAWLLSLSGMPEVSSMTPMQGGWDNTNFLLSLTDGTSVVLKAWDANTVDEVARVILRH